MKDGGTFGHVFMGEEQRTDYIVPKNIDTHHVIVITTMWSKKEKKGETLQLVIPKKSFWATIDNPPVQLGVHKSERTCFDFHENEVKKIKDSDYYG